LPWPTYRLNWTFPKGKTSAAPDGTVAVKGSRGEALTGTVRAGALNIRGTDKTGAKVNEDGRVVVNLEGTPPEALTVNVSGLSPRAQALALTTPFGSSDAPVRIPLK